MERSVEEQEHTVEERTVDETSGLLPQDYVAEFRSRWSQIQTGFVDYPRTAVQQADQLVGETINRLAQDFGAARARLEEQWASGDNVSTEDLRVAFKKYRTFFEKLLSV